MKFLDRVRCLDANGSNLEWKAEFGPVLKTKE